MIRILDFREVRYLEDQLILRSGDRQFEQWIDQLVDPIAKSLFGLRAKEQYEAPEHYWKLPEDDEERERIDEAFWAFEDSVETTEMSDDEVVMHLLKLGVDFRDERGIPLRCTKLLARAAELAAKGTKGQLPDTSRI